MKLIQEYLHEKRLRIIEKHVGSELLDLDIGAGGKPKAKISLDINGEIRPNIVADVEYLPIRSGAVKSLVCSHVIEHVRDLNRAMSEVKRILIKDGVAVFFLPNDRSKLWRILEFFWSIYYEKTVSKHSSPRTHLQSFGFESFRNLIEKFFEPLKVSGINLDMEIYAVCQNVSVKD